MNIDEIIKRTDEIKACCAIDPEAAHSLEDSLRNDFIEYISTLDNPVASKAAIVLSTNEIEFPRWCA